MVEWYGFGEMASTRINSGVARALFVSPGIHSLASRDFAGPTIEAKNSRTASVLTRVDAVESYWLSDRQDLQADYTAGLLEEIEPQAWVV